MVDGRSMWQQDEPEAISSMVVVLHPEAYTALTEMAQSALPAESIGLLLVNSRYASGKQLVNVKAVTTVGRGGANERSGAPRAVRGLAPEAAEVSSTEP